MYTSFFLSIREIDSHIYMKSVATMDFGPTNLVIDYALLWRNIQNFEKNKKNTHQVSAVLVGHPVHQKNYLSDLKTCTKFQISKRYLQYCG